MGFSKQGFGSLALGGRWKRGWKGVGEGGRVGGGGGGVEGLNFYASNRGQKLNTNFFCQTFRTPPGYPSKILGYPAKKV